jgi:BMFP domain-containing protein YqiC
LHHFRELEAEVKRLTQRVEALEARLQDGKAEGAADETAKAVGSTE